ncbi:antitoxin [Saccharothrix deserti]|uniref:antitoxin n=1 Tax=Saccharothrix deserti TaxID=2593674 RepID=UPI00131B2E29|nr:antitoxin [Saccharothrix deserti]
MSERDTKPVHIRDVPADVVDTLQARANAEGMSLTAYLRNAFIEMAGRPTMSEIYQRSWPRPWSIDGETLQHAVREAREEDE